MRGIVEGYGLEFSCVGLATVYSDNMVSDSTYEGQLREFFANISTLTSKEDMLTYLRNSLLIKIARDQGWVSFVSVWSDDSYVLTSLPPLSCRYPKIITGDSATRFATKIIASTCKGRGFGLHDDLQFVDSRFQSDDGTVTHRNANNTWQTNKQNK
jgi:hypothetical protein